MATIQATRLRRGMLIKLHDNLFRVLELQHVTPGNKRGFVQSKLRNVRAGTLTDHKFSSGDFVEQAMLDARKMQFLYADGEGYHFMDTESYEQIQLDAETLGDSTNYLLPDATITVEFFEEAPVGIGLPLTVDLTVEETATGHQGRHRERAAQAGPARDRARRAGSALHRQRRQGAREHGDRGVPGAGIAGSRRLAPWGPARAPPSPCSADRRWAGAPVSRRQRKRSARRPTRPDPLRHRVAQPVGRRQPDEGQDRDHHQVVLPSGALEGPEQGVPHGEGGERDEPPERHAVASPPSERNSRHV